MVVGGCGVDGLPDDYPRGMKDMGSSLSSSRFEDYSAMAMVGAKM